MCHHYCCFLSCYGSSRTECTYRITFNITCCNTFLYFSICPILWLHITKWYRCLCVITKCFICQCHKFCTTNRVIWTKCTIWISANISAWSPFINCAFCPMTLCIGSRKRCLCWRYCHCTGKKYHGNKWW